MCRKHSFQVRFEPQVQLQCLHFGFIRNPVCWKYTEQDPFPNVLFHLTFRVWKERSF